MRFKLLDSWLGRTVMRRKANLLERRSGRDRRQITDRRRHMRSGMQIRSRRSEVERRTLQS